MIAPLVLLLATQVQATPVVVTVEVPEPVSITAGGRAEARLVARIKKGFRIQANPASNRFLVPAELKLSEDERVHAGHPKYPPGIPHRLRGASSDLSVYEDELVIRVPLEAPPAALGEAESALDVVLEGSLRFQACNEQVCLRPTSVPARVPVRIEPGGAPEGR